MKRIVTWVIFLCCLLGFSVSCQALDQQAVNRRLGYFENTRTVLLLPAVYRSGGSEAAVYMNREMNQIFRYPYYRTLDVTDYAGKVYAPSQLPQLAEEAGADIVIMPVVTTWIQRVYHRSFFMDADDIVETRAVLDIYSYKKDGEVRDDRATYWNTEEDGLVRNRYILSDMMQKLYKTFPYRRVPTDVARNLSGDIEKDETPKADMNH